MTIDFLEPTSEFQTSVNIGYDLNNKTKIKNFIPTTSAVSLLEEILLSTDNTATNRAHILIGAYGKGKSHIVLAILSLLYHKDIDTVESLLSKVRAINPELYNYACIYLEGNKKLLPVIISGNSTSLSQAFLRALHTTLKQNNLNDIMPETSFEMALRMVGLWKKQYPAVYDSLQEELPMPISEFEHALREYDASAYNMFEAAYPKLTAGNEFNPFTGYDVVELYEDVAKKVKDVGYSGLYVIYDEFSKYLESSITKASVNDIKMLQDFAEKCSRSGERQLHLLLISHKEIENYIDILPKQKVDGWRGVSERFLHISMQTDYPQTYEILSSAIRKNDSKWTLFKQSNKEFFTQLGTNYSNSLFFADCNSEQLREAIIECYPLHPVTTFMLPRISERVAQNERTLFTFVAGQDNSCLHKLSIASEIGIPTVTPDCLYDYFAPLMRKEAYTTETHRLYQLASEALSLLQNDSLDAKIIKTICLIYCIGQFNVLPPTVENIVDIYRSEAITTQNILDTIDSLIKKQLVVYLKRSNAYLQLKRASGVDIYSEITNTVEKRKTVINMADILNSANVEPYLYPIHYNDEYNMTRYFSFRFATVESLESSDVNTSIAADGIIYGVIPSAGQIFKESADKLVKKYSSYRQVMLVFPDAAENIREELQTFDAVSLLRADLSDDEALKSEYDIIYFDLLEVINHYIAQYIHPELHESVYWHAGKQLKLYRKSQLTECLSQICRDVFPDTPVINNEVLNRTRLTAVAINSRTKVLAALMQKELEPNLGLSGSGQEVSFMRSALLMPGILQQNDSICTLNENTKDKCLTSVLRIITEFLEETKGNGLKSFAELYSNLQSPANGIGLRKGLIPIYLAVALHKYNEHVIIWDELSEQKLTPAVLNQINENPESYRIQVEEWTDSKETYISGIATIFSDYVIEKEKAYSSYSYISLAMGRWYLSLPRYVKDTKREYDNGEFKDVSKQYRDFLTLLKRASIGAQELLFAKLPKCFGRNTADEELINEIKQVKLYFDSYKSSLESALISYTSEILSPETATNGLAACAIAWTDLLSQNAKIKLYQDGAERMIAVLSNPENNEYALIEKLAKTIVGLRIDDWNDSSVEVYLNKLKQLKKTVDDENSKKVESAPTEIGTVDNRYSVTFVGENGDTKRRVFDRVTPSKRAKLLYNLINDNIQEMGQSITVEEKRQILMEILENLC